MDPLIEPLLNMYVLIERDENKAITQVRVFSDEIVCWTAYETCTSCYATVHAATPFIGEPLARLSSERSEFLGIGTEE